jgi:hypothetical protein
MSSQPPALAWSDLLTELARVSGVGLLDLLRADQQRCWQRGRRLPVEVYSRRLPQLRHDDALFLDLVWSEVLLREGLCETPTPAEYAQRFPQFAAELGRRFALRVEFTQPLPTAPADGQAATLPPPVTPAVGLPEPTAPRSERGGRRLRIGGYEVLGLLGEGGMGVVYRARHLQLGHEVALKMILAGGHASPEYLARFQLEAAAVARLNHPGIVHLHEFGEHDGSPFFSLELVAGGSLAARLKEGPLPPRQAAALVQKLAQAMQHAHEHGILHRDLKPANVLLTPEGEPKITDFGLAKRLGADAGLSVTGAVLGTPSYMAPEQAEGRLPDVGPATDVYALGAILYECLTGQPPFRGSTVQETLEMVSRQEPAGPRRLLPTLSWDLETVCLRCLEKEATKRYATAADLADDLKRYLDGEPVRARPVGWLDRQLRWLRRHPKEAWAYGLAVVAAVLLLLGGGFGWLWQSAEQARNEARNAFQQAEQNLYFLRIARAERAWRESNLALTEQLLDECRHNTPDLCLLEWSYLKRLCHTELLNFRGHDGQVWCAAFSPDGQTLVSSATVGRTGSRVGEVKVWDAENGKESYSLPGNGKAIFGVAFSPDGRRLATAREDHTVEVWDLVRRQRLFPPLRWHGGEVFSVGFSPDGKHLASGSWDQTVKVWDARTGQRVRSLPGHAGWVQSVVFSHDGKRLASGSTDATVKVWDVVSGQELLSLQDADAVNSVAFHPDGWRLAGACDDKTVKVWGARPAEEEQGRPDRASGP